jgi:hypothetical protein
MLHVKATQKYYQKLTKAIRNIIRNPYSCLSMLLRYLLLFPGRLLFITTASIAFFATLPIGKIPLITKVKKQITLLSTAA